MKKTNPDLLRDYKRKLLRKALIFIVVCAITIVVGMYLYLRPMLLQQGTLSIIALVLRNSIPFILGFSILMLIYSKAHFQKWW